MLTPGALIGRESELAALEAMLSGTRALTVTGAGGCGKTALALTLAGRVACPERGSLLVALSDIKGEEQLVDALLAALGARERFGSTPMQVLIERISSRRLLLVLDNCEHLLDALRALTGQLLDGAPELQLLMTSREPLELDGESVFRLGSLGLPDAGDIGALMRSDAARLFIDRAARSDPTFALTPSTAQSVADICRELDGLPLALVLAAARLDTLSPEQVARGLREHGHLSTVAERQQRSRHSSLRSSLDWSYHLLDERQRLLLRGLSVFAGGFSSAAAHAVATPDADPQRVHEDLEALEAKGLIARASGKARERWMLLQTVAEYAAEQLALQGEDDAIFDRHALWFGAWAARADEELLQVDGHRLIDEEAPNLRRAFHRGLQRDPDRALAMAASLMRHWILDEHFHEARLTCAAVLARASESTDTDALALVHCGAALVAMLSEDYEGALTGTQTGLALLGAVEDTGVQASCLSLSSMVLIQTGANLQGGLDNAERAVELAQQADDELGLAHTLVNLTVAAMLCERFQTVQEAYERFLAIEAAREHPRLRAWAEQAVAWSQVNSGSPVQALAHIDRASALEGEWPSMTYFQVLGFRIQALARMGQADQALALSSDALRRARESGALQSVPAIELALMVAEFMRGDLDAAGAHARALLVMPQLHTLALVHDTLGHIALVRGDLDAAQVHASELEALAQRSGSERQRALSHYIAGCAALQASETARARELLHLALATCAELDLQRDCSDVLDELALLAAAAEEVQRGARLAGAAAAARERLGSLPGPDTAKRLEAARARLVSHDGLVCWESAWTQGQALTLADAVAYARRRRGSRDRPAAGWESLTPVELDVAELAASGISNPQIAAQLFVARGTVKMHLSSIYRKLDVSNRVELATVITARASQRQSGEPRATADSRALTDP